jgi:hypothetical protein
VVAVFGCASTLAAEPGQQPTCPASVDGYTAGESTSEFVKECLGIPIHEDHNPDGRFVYLYQIDGKTKVAFLFDASGKLIRTRGYQQN